MKTTIDFPDELLHRAKIISAQRRTTLRELAVQGFERALKSEVSEEAVKKQRVRNLLDALQASNTEPMIPLTREEIYDRHS